MTLFLSLTIAIITARSSRQATKVCAKKKLTRLCRKKNCEKKRSKNSMGFETKHFFFVNLSELFHRYILLVSTKAPRFVCALVHFAAPRRPASLYRQVRVIACGCSLCNDQRPLERERESHCTP